MLRLFVRLARALELQPRLAYELVSEVSLVTVLSCHLFVSAQEGGWLRLKEKERGGRGRRAGTLVNYAAIDVSRQPDRVRAMPSETIEKLRAAVRDVPDFPKSGVVFKDITP